MRIIGNYESMNNSHLNHENHHQPHVLDTKRLPLFRRSVVLVFLILQSFIYSLYHSFISHPCCNFLPVKIRRTLISYIYRILILHISRSAAVIVDNYLFEKFADLRKFI